MPPIVHRVRLRDPKTHLVEVETTIECAAATTTIVLAMPVWTPGSYLVREYARHVEGLSADAPARATKERKNAWRIDTGGATRVVVRYRVYANELTVRTNHVDDTHALLVGAALFFAVEGREMQPARVEIEAPPGWRVATALPRRDGAFEAPDFDTLVDCPIEAGTHREERFEACLKPHRYAIWPASAISDDDARRLVDDTRLIVETEAKLFGGSLPYDSYDFLLHLSPRGRGGLEHRASATLLASTTAFAARDSYLDLLSLVAHELFHAWNIKRIRPAALVPYRYDEESYTRLLWWFEGGTSYFDWRTLALSGLCTVEEYLDHLAAEIAYVEQAHGRLVHALEEASFDAWIKLYRPDDNSLNSSISYYRKGEVVCAMLDLEMRAKTAGRASLDRVVAHLWSDHGARDRPVPEDAMQAIFEHVAEAPLGDLFGAWIRSPGEVDVDRAVAHVGLAIERTPRGETPCSLGARLRADGARTTVASVAREGAAWRAGVDPGDELIAIGGVRVEGASADGALRGRKAGEIVDVVVARDGRVLTKRATLDPPRADRMKIVARKDAPEPARNAFAAWLGAPHPAWGKP